MFTFHLVGKRVAVFLNAEDNQFVFNAKQNLISTSNTHNHMTKHVFGPENVYDVPQCVIMEQKRLTKCVCKRRFHIMLLLLDLSRLD